MNRKIGLVSPSNYIFIILTAALLVMAVTILGYQSYKTAEQITLEKFHQGQRTRTRGAIQEIELYFKTIAIEIRSLGKRLGSGSHDVGQIRRAMQQSYNGLQHMGATDIWIVDGNGCLEYSVVSPMLEGMDLSWTAYVKNMKDEAYDAGFVVRFTDFTGLDTDDKRILVAMPMPSVPERDALSNGFSGAVVCLITLDTLSQPFLSSLESTGLLNGVLIDEEYNILWSSDGSMCGENLLNDTGLLPVALQKVRLLGFGQVGEERHTYYEFKEEKGLFSIADEAFLIVYTTFQIGENVWSLGLWTPKGMVWEQIRSVYLQLSILVGISILIITVSALIALQRSSKIEKSLSQYSADLEVSNQLKNLFMDIMTHDILNPTVVIKGIAFIGQTKHPEDSSMALIYESSRRIEEIVENAYILFNIRTQASLEKKGLNLAQIVQTEYEKCKSLFESVEMQLENRIANDLTIQANPIIHQVFFNILTNAVKYASEGKRVVVEAEKEHSSHIIRITDYGPGIPDEYKEGLFDRFSRREKLGVKGVGLGLAIVKRVMELHNGKVWVGDNSRGGSIFYVYLPGEE